MKVGILAGGAGTRLAEETEIRPKPMVEIGGKPILWHIMKHYSMYGYNDFVVACGYKGDYIKRFFVEYFSVSSDLTVNLASGQVTAHDRDREEWTLELVDTGAWTYTGGRIKRLAPYFGDETFMLALGDGVSDIDLDALVQFHRSHGRLATIATVRPPARFGRLEVKGNAVVSFEEKPQLSEGWINGGIFVLEPGVIEYIEGDKTMWEHEPLERLAKDGELMAYYHESFWQCMDTLRDKRLLNRLWDSGDPPWKTWD